MKTNTKKYGMTALLGVLIVGIILISGCVQESEEEHATEQPTEKPAGEPGVGSSDWCNERAAAYIVAKSGADAKTGIEKHTINGKTVDLCCIEATAEESAIMKMCFSKDREYTVSFGYDEETGKMYKSMEVYPEGDKHCTRAFNPDGTVVYEGCVQKKKET